MKLIVFIFFSFSNGGSAKRSPSWRSPWTSEGNCTSLMLKNHFSCTVSKEFFVEKLSGEMLIVIKFSLLDGILYVIGLIYYILMFFKKIFFHQESDFIVDFFTFPVHTCIFLCGVHIEKIFRNINRKKTSNIFVSVKQF